MRLIEAAKHGDNAVIQRLICEGVGIDAAASKGITALVIACCAGKLETVRLLINAGADKSLKDDLGYDAYQAAMFLGDFRGVTVEPCNQIMTLLKNED